MTQLSVEERASKRKEMEMVNELIHAVGQKMFNRENECHLLGIRHFEDSIWQMYNKEHEQLLARK